MGKGDGKAKGKGKPKGKGKGKGKGKARGDGEEEGAGGVATELHTAAREGNLEQVDAILSDEEKKEMINSMDQHRLTPLHLAAFFGKTEAVEKLLEKGADPQLVAMDGFLPLHFAAQSGHLEVLRLIVKKLGSKGEHGVIKRHVNRVVSKGKRSALHLALQKGHSECAKFLAMKSASTELMTAQGQTALDLCQNEELRKELAGHAKKAKEEEDEENEGEDAETQVTEPPVKKRAVESSDPSGAAAVPVPVAVDSPPMRGLPSQPKKPSAPGLLCSGPLPLGQVKLQADATEKSYPAGVPAMADVEWDLKVKEEPSLTDGPVWCLQDYEEDDNTKRLTLRIQKSSKRLLHYTHFSDEALMIAKEARCNACGLILLMESEDGLLLFERKEEGTCLPQSGSLTSDSLSRQISEAVTSFALPSDAASAALGSARLLGVLDVGEDAPNGHRHELVLGLRLPKTAAEVKSSAGDAQELVFVSFPGLEVAAPDATSSLEEILSESSKLPQMHERAVKLLQALRADA